jgi:hypothetical protein
VSMRKSIFGVAGVWIVAGVFGVANAAEEPQTLTGAQLIAEVVGNTIRYENDAKDVVNEYYAADGTIHGRSKMSGDYSAVWEIRFGNMFCIVQDDPMQSGCVTVIVRGDKIEFHRRDGVVEGPFELRHENPERL